MKHQAGRGIMPGPDGEDSVPSESVAIKLPTGANETGKSMPSPRTGFSPQPSPRGEGKKAWQVSAVIIIVIPDFHPICEDVPVCMHGVYMLSCRLT